MTLPASGNPIALAQVSSELGYNSDSTRTMDESAVRTLFGASASPAAIAMSSGFSKSFCPANGTYTNYQYCSGYTLIRRYYNGTATNGSCNTYDSTYQTNSTTCGYNPAVWYSLYCSGDAYLCTGCGDDDDSAGGLQSCINCGYYTYGCAGSYWGTDAYGCTLYIGTCCGCADLGSCYLGDSYGGGCNGGCC